MWEDGSLSPVFLREQIDCSLEIVSDQLTTPYLDSEVDARMASAIEKWRTQSWVNLSFHFYRYR